MATILPFVKDGVFDQKDITAMSMALDDVCKILNLRDDSSAREVIAIRIVDLARTGERSPTRLRDRILHEACLLYTSLKQVETEFDGDNLRFEFHLAPPLLARRDKTTGLPRKMSFGPWLLPAFRLLAKFKFLRGSALDPFGRSQERRTERKLIEDYLAVLDEVLGRLTPDNHHLAVGLAAIPEKIRGFGHVKQRHLTAAKADEAALFEQFRSVAPALLNAAE